MISPVHTIDFLPLTQNKEYITAGLTYNSRHLYVLKTLKRKFGCSGQRILRLPPKRRMPQYANFPVETCKSTELIYLGSQASL